MIVDDPHDHYDSPASCRAAVLAAQRVSCRQCGYSVAASEATVANIHVNRERRTESFCSGPCADAYQYGCEG